MQSSIENFAQEFSYTPDIVHAEKLRDFSGAIMIGMGGSHLAAGLYNSLVADQTIHVHSDYGLPQFSTEHLDRQLIVISSYSGNTEEVVNAYHVATKAGLNVVVITAGGQLAELASADQTPHILLPNTGIQPRLAVGYSIIALATVMQNKTLLTDLQALSESLSPESLHTQGKTLAEKFQGKAPMIYASRRNHSLAYNWKIKLNETGKTPASYNVFPELNHNEMQGFAASSSTASFAEKIGFVFVMDDTDHPRIKLRMETTRDIMIEQGYVVETVTLTGASPSERIFNGLVLADWFSLELANLYNHEPEAVALIEDFKRRIA